MLVNQTNLENSCFFVFSSRFLVAFKYMFAQKTLKNPISTLAAGADSQGGSAARRVRTPPLFLLQFMAA